MLLTLGGMGMLSHIGDYSAHLLSFTFYYLGILLVFDSGVWHRAASLRTHVLIGTFLALACLQYNTGIALTLGYVLVSVRHNAWSRVALGAAIALTAQPAWARVIERAAGVEIYAVERAYLSKSVSVWARILEDPLGRGAMALHLLLEFATFDSPLVVIGGVLGMARLWRRRGVPSSFLAFILLPVAAGMLYGFEAGARGYLIYGISLLFYVALAGGLARLLRGRFRGLGVLATGIVLVTHVAWGTAFLWGHLGPIKTYFLGVDDGWPVLTAARLTAESVTGHEVTPVLFGGSGRLADAGLHAGDPSRSAAFTFTHAVAARAFFVPYLLVLVALWSRPPTRVRRIILTASASVLLAVPPVFVHARPSINGQIEEAYRLLPGETLRYSALVSDRCRMALTEENVRDYRLQLYMRASDGETHRHSPVRLVIGGKDVPVAPIEPRYLWSIDRATFLSALRNGSELQVEIGTAPNRPTIIGGWQSRALPGRQLIVPDRLRDVEVLPLLEIRAVNGNGIMQRAWF